MHSNKKELYEMLFDPCASVCCLRICVTKMFVYMFSFYYSRFSGGTAVRISVGMGYASLCDAAKTIPDRV